MIVSCGSPPPRLRRWRASALFALFTALAMTASAATVNWNVDADGNWATGSNWSTGSVPGPSDDVVIDRPAGTYTITISSGAQVVNSLTCTENLSVTGGSLDLAAASSIAGNLALSNGTISGAGNVTLSGSGGSWGSATWSGAGTTYVSGTIALNGGGSKVLSGRRVELTGTMIHSGTGNVMVRSGAVLEIMSSGLFEVQTSNYVYNDNPGTGTLINRGTIRKTTAGGGFGYCCGSPFVFQNLGGNLEATAGTLGIASIGPSAGLLSGGTYTVSGSGSVAFSDGTFDVTGTLAGTPSGTGSVRLVGATFQTTAGGASLALGGTGFDWQSGTITGSGTTSVTGSMVLTGGSGKYLVANRMEIGGAVTKADGNNLFVRNGAVIEVLPGGLFDQQSNTLVYNDTSGAAVTFINRGTLRRSVGTGVGFGYCCGWPFAFQNLGGTIDAQTGTLTIASTSATGALAGGTYNSSGSGLISFSNGTFDLSGTLSGTAAGSGGVRLDGAVFRAVAAGATLAIGGNGLSWQSGSLSGLGATEIANGGDVGVAGADSSDLRGKLFGAVAHGSGAAVPAGILRRIWVHSDTAGQSVTVGVAVAPGTPELLSAAVTTAVGWAAVDVDWPWDAATLFVYKKSGSGRVSFAASAPEDSWYSDDNGVTWQQDAARRGFKVEMRTDAFTNTGVMGTLGGPDKVMVGGHLRNQGTFVFDGTGYLYPRSGSTITNLAGATFDIRNDRYIYNDQASTPPARFRNLGTIAKTAGIATSHLGYSAGQAMTWSNTGTIESRTGILTLEQGGELVGGTYTALEYGAGIDAVVDFASGTFDLSGTLVGAGAGQVRLTSAAFRPAASGARLNFTGAPFEWQGGTLVAQGTAISIANGGDTGLTGYDTTDFRGKLFGAVSHGSGSAMPRGAIRRLWVYSDTASQPVVVGLSATPGSPELYSATVTTAVGWASVDVDFPWEADTLFIYKKSGSGRVAYSTSAPEDSWYSNDGGLNYLQDPYRRGYRVEVRADHLTNVGLLSTTGSASKYMASSFLRNEGTFVLDGNAYLHARQGSWITNLGTFEVRNGQYLYNDQTNPYPSRFRNLGSLTKTGGSTSYFGYSAGQAMAFENRGSIAPSSGTIRFEQGLSNRGAFAPTASGVIEFANGQVDVETGSTFTGTGTVRLTGPTMMVNTDITVACRFEHQGGTVNGAGNVAVTGRFVWSGGDVRGSGTTLTVAATGILERATSNTVNLRERTLYNDGLIDWNGTGYLIVGAGALLQNRATGLIDLKTDSYLYNNGSFGGTGAFENLGTVRKSAGTGASHLGYSGGSTFSISNLGSTLEVQTGSLHIEQGGNHTGGTWNVAGGSYLDLDAGTLQLSGAHSGSGAGTVRVNGSTLNVASGTATISLPSGQFGITGGVVAGAGTLRIMSPSTVSNTFSINGGHLENAATMTWTGGNIQMGNAGTFANLASATFDIQSITQINNGVGGASGSMSNAGLLKKTAGAAVNYFLVPFSSSGTVDVQLQRLEMYGISTTLGGALTISSGAEFRIAVGGGLSLQNGFVATGSGLLNHEAGTSSIAAGATASVAKYQQSGGTLTVDGTLQLGDFVFTGGTLAGTGDVNVATGLTWSNGIMQGAGRTRLLAGSTSTSSLGQINLSRELEIAGDMDWSGELRAGNGSFVDVLGTGTLEVFDDVQFSNYFGGSSTIVNAGQFRKVGGTGLKWIYLPFTNNGTLEVASGSLRLDSGLTNYSAGTLTGGTYIVKGSLAIPSAALATCQAAVTLDGATSSITNTLGVDAVTSLTSIGAAGSLTLRGGRDQAIAGALTNAGAVAVQDVGSRLLLTGNYTQTAGSTTISSQGNLAAPLVNIQAGTLSGGSNGTGATVFADDFENPATMTTKWTVTTGPGPHTCGPWMRATDSFRLPAMGSGAYAVAASDLCPIASQTSTILTSIPIDVSNPAIQSLVLEYDIYYRHFNGDDSTVEVWNGSQWVVLWADTNQAVNGHHLWDVSAYALGNPAFQVRFSYQNAGWDWWFAIDDVRLASRVAVTGNVQNAGTLLPGSSPGTFSIDGNYTQTASGSLAIELQGTTAGSQHDYLAVSGAAALNGTLAVTRPGGYTPAGGSQHRVLSYASRSGDFATKTGLTGLPGGAYLDPVYDADDLTLVTTGGLDVSIGNVTVTEGDSGTVTANFTVTLSSPSPGGVSVAWSTANGVARAGRDFVAASGTSNFGIGETTKPIAVTVNGDRFYELEERFYVDLSNPVGVGISDARGDGIITDDDPVSPNLVANGSCEEPLAGTEIPAWTEVSGTGWTQVDGGPGDEQLPYAGSYYFYAGVVANGELRQDVDLSGLADRIDAGIQRFEYQSFVSAYDQIPADASRVVLEMRDAANTSVLESYDSGELVNRTSWTEVIWTTNSSPSVTSSWAFDEGPVNAAATGSIVDSGPGGANGTPSGGPIYRSDAADGLALELDGADDVVSFGSVFPFHQVGDATVEFSIKFTPTAHQALIWARPDSTNTNRFNFFVNSNGTFGFDYLSPTNVSHILVGGLGTGVAIPADTWTRVAIVRAGNVYSVYVNGVFASSATDAAPDLPTAVGWSIAGRAGFRFAGKIDRLRFSNRALAAGELLAVRPNDGGAAGDGSDPPNARVRFGGDLPTAVPAGTRYARIRLLARRYNGTNNNGYHDAVSLRPLDLPEVSVGDVTQAEGTGGSTNFVFPVTLNGAGEHEVQFAWTTAADTATAGTDFAAASGTVTIPAGQTAGSITVTVTADAVAEIDERFSVQISGITNAAARELRAVGNIVDDDHTVTGPDDDFSAATLDPQWSWVREDASRWSIADGLLTIRTQPGSLGTSNDADNLLVQPAPAGDWTIETRVLFAPTTNDQQAGLLVRGSDDDWVFLGRAYTGGSNVVMLARESQGYAESESIVFSATTSYLRLTRSGCSFTAWASSDGVTWSQVGQIGEVAMVTPTIGLGAWNGAATANIGAQFDYFHWTSYAVTAFFDDFASSTLVSGWSWIRENPATHSWNPGPPTALRIVNENGDLWQGTNTARNLLLRAAPAGDYSIVAKVAMAVNENSEGAELLFYEGDDDHVRLRRSFSSQDAVDLVREEGGVAFVRSVHQSGSPTWLRVDRVCDGYYGFVSVDGSDWREIWRLENVHVDPTMVGLAAYPGPVGLGSPATADFDFFEIRPFVVQTRTLPGPTVGQSYTPSLVAENAAAAVTWSVVGGSLPPGISLSGAGVFSGSPTQSGEYAFAVSASDGAATATAHLGIHVGGATALDDEFAAAALDPKWQVVRPDASNWSLTAVPGNLRLITQPQQLDGGPNNVENLFLQAAPSGDFEVVTKVRFAPRSDYQHAGLLVYQDDSNYVALVRDRTAGAYPYQVAIFYWEIDGSVTWYSTPLESRDTYLRIVRVGNDYSGYYSLDGQDWIAIGTRPSFDLSGERVGLYAAHGSGIPAPPIPADFDFFHVRPYDESGRVEEFDSCSLGPEWFVVREDATHWQFFPDCTSPDRLRITLQDGDLWGGSNSARNLFLRRAPAGNWSVISRIALAPTANYQQAGVFVYQDDSNYLRLMREYGNGQNVHLIREINGNPEIIYGTQAATTTWLRLDKIGSAYHAYHGTNGSVWTKLGDYTASLQAPAVGFGGFAAGGAEIPADFQVWKLQSLLILDRSLAGGVVGASYSTTPTISGAIGAQTWTVQSGALPPGLSLNGASGEISGIPTVAGNYAFVLALSDASGAQTTAEESIVIAPGSPYDDEFSTGTLDPKWTIVRPDATHYSLSSSPGSLVITSKAGQLYGSTNNTGNIFLQNVPAGDFEVTTRVHFDPTQNYQGASLVLRQSDDDYLHVFRAYSSGVGGDIVGVELEVGGAILLARYIPFTADDLYLRLTRYRNDFTAWYSVDGVNWTAAAVAYDRPLAPLQMGVTVANGSPSSALEIPARFDFFHWNPYTVPLVDDGFPSVSLDSAWSWKRENAANHAWVPSGTTAVRINTEAGTLVGSTNSAKNLLLRTAPAGDWSAVTKVAFAPTASDQRASLLVYGSDDSWVEAARVYANAQLGMGSREAAWNYPTVGLSAHVTSTTSWLRIDRVGMRYVTSISADGASWRELYRFELPNFVPDKIGLMAANTAGTPPTIAADFDFFRIAPLVVRSLALDSCTMGSACNRTLDAANVNGSANWSLLPGQTLPPGLVLAPSGAISGSPTSVGLFAFEVETTDGAGLPTQARISLGVVEPYSAGVLDDGFEGALNSKWSWIRESPANHSLAARPGWLRITTLNGDFWGGGAASDENLLAQPVPSGDFRVTTRVKNPGRTAYQLAGLVLYQDDDNYIRFNLHQRTDGFKYIQTARETSASPTEQLRTVEFDEVFLRLTLTGDILLAEWSTDGTNWILEKSWSSVAYSNPKILLQAISAATNVSTTVDFDFVRVEAFQPSAMVEEFESCNLDPAWTIVREDVAKYQWLPDCTTPTALRLFTKQGTFQGCCENAANLFLRSAPAGNYSLLANVAMTPTANEQQFLLLFHQDDANWVAAGRRFNSTQKAVAIVESSDSPTVTESANSLATFRLRLDRVGDTYYAWISPDGTNWTSLHATPSGSIAKVLSAPRVGFLAYNRTTATETAADVDRFEIQPFLITTRSLTNPFFGTPYSQPVLVKQPTGAVTFDVARGALPPGLSLGTTDGVISGAATTDGTYEFQIRAADSGGHVSTAEYAVTVAHGITAHYYNGVTGASPAFGTLVSTTTENPGTFSYTFASPPAGVSNPFEARWTGYLTPPTTGNYVFDIVAKQGYRFYLGGRLLRDRWYDRGTDATERSIPIHLLQGQAYALAIEWYEYSLPGSIAINVTPPSASSIPLPLTWIGTGAPVIVRSSPAFGAIGTSLAITGGNFGASQGSSTVFVGGVAATNVSGWAEDRFTVQIPVGATPNASGAYDLMVSTSSGANPAFPIWTQPHGVSIDYYNSNLFPVPWGGVNGVEEREAIAVDWREAVPVSGVNGNFSARMAGRLTVLQTGNWTFDGCFDDQASLIIGVTAVLSQASAGCSSATPISLTAGTPTVVRLELRDGNTYAYATLNATAPDGTRQVVPADWLQSGPVLLELQPSAGFEGENVTIRGVGFGTVAGDLTVTFNGVAAIFQMPTEDEIVATVPSGIPPGTNGDADVVVTRLGRASNALPYSFFGCQAQVSGAPGNAPLGVSFTGQAFNGVGSISYSWDLNGDAVEDSTAQNPGFVYTAAGTYTATLTVRDSAVPAHVCTSNVLVQVNAYPSCTATAVPTSGAKPLDVTFGRVLSGGTGPYFYQWDFETDSTWDSTAQSPPHTYNTTGTHTATLRITDSSATPGICTDTIDIVVLPYSCNANGAPTFGTVPLEVDFTSSVSGAIAPVTYDWNFGDGTGHSTLANPTHVYVATGTFNAVLTVTDATFETCQKTVVVTVNPIPALVCSTSTLTPTSGSAPLTVTGNGTASGGTPPYRWVWEWGDGTASSTIEDPTHIYTGAGSFAAKVTVSDSSPTVKTCEKNFTISVSGISLSVTALPAAGPAPLTVTFSPTWSGGSAPFTWEWDFDGDLVADSTLTAPTHVFTASGTHQVRAKIRDQFGLEAIRFVSVTAEGLKIKVVATPVIGRPPMSVSFNTQITGGNPPFFYSWNFGDGGPGSSQKNPSHTYYANGDFVAEVTVSDSAAPADVQVATVGITVGGWPMFHYDLQHTGRAPYLGSDGGSLKWSFYAGQAVYGSPAVDSNGRIFIGSVDGTLWALQPDGTVAWSAQTSGAILSSPSVNSEGRVFVGSADGKVYAFDAIDGDLIWTFQTDGPIASSPTPAADGGVYIGSDDGSFYLIDANGQLNRAKHLTDKATRFDPERPVDRGFAFIPITGVRSSSGTTNTSSAMVGDASGTVWSISNEGEALFAYNTEGEVVSSVAIGPDGTSYVGSADGKLHAIAADGTGAWTFTTGGPIVSSPAVAGDGKIIFGSDDQKLYALNADGTEAWNYPTGGAIRCAPAIGSDGRIYFTSADGFVYSVNANGTLSWSQTYVGIGSSEAQTDLTSSPSIGANGTLYVATGSGAQVLAFQDYRCDATASPGVGVAPLSVSFAGIVNGGSAPFNYSWDFDDPPSTGSGASTTHLFSNPGSYDVVMTVTDGSSSICQKTIPITVTAVPLLSLTADASPATGNAPLPASFTTSVAGGTPSYTYTWDFGDGSAAGNGASASHTYTAPGTYTARVTVVDAGLPQQTQAYDLVVSAALSPLSSAMTAGPLLEGEPPLSVDFTSSVAGGTIPYAFAWDFDGNGTVDSTLQNPSHTYLSEGVFAATVTMTDASNPPQAATKKVTVVVATPLQASISADVTSGAPPLAVNFAASGASGVPPYASYAWMFGDGATASGASVAHSYTSNGLYSACVEVTDARATKATSCLPISVSGGSCPGGALELRLAKNPGGGVVLLWCNDGRGTYTVYRGTTASSLAGWATVVNQFEWTDSGGQSIQYYSID